MADGRTDSCIERPVLSRDRNNEMEEFLQQLMGKRIDVSCGAGAAFRGDVVDVKGGILFLRDDDDRIAYVVIDRIALITEAKENSTRPGFVV
jgi:hypothetical protein